MIFDDCTMIKDRNNKEFYFLEFIAPDFLKCGLLNTKQGTNSIFYGKLPVSRLSVVELQRIKVWDLLSEEIRKGIENFEVTDRDSIHEKMKKARESRQLKYPDVPKSITCIECGKVQNMAASLIVKKAEKWALDNQFIPDIDKWIKQWKCNECLGIKKGRKANHNLPPKIELKCACGKIVTYPASVVVKIIEKKKLTLEEYIKGYSCRKCSPCSSFGRKKNHNLPPKVELKCKCGASVTYPASVVAKTIEKKKLTLEEYISDYHCQTCRPSKGRKKGKKGKK